MKADFYAVQVEVDGYGNTITLAIFKTKNEAQKYVKTRDFSWIDFSGCFSDEPVRIVPQTWGKYKSVF